MLELVWWWWLLLLPLPGLMPLLLSSRQAADEPALSLDTLPLHIASPPGNADRRRHWLRWLLWTALLLASSRPVWVGEPVFTPRSGRDLMLAVDLSGSMQIRDMVLDNRAVDRLTMLKAVLDPFIASRQGDRLGLILFADHAYLQAPLTHDLAAIRRLLDESELGLVGEHTAIGEAIGLALKRFVDADNPQRVLLLVTDGRNTAGELSPVEAARFAAGHGVTLYAVGVGAEALIESGLFGRRRVNPSQDLDEDTLQQLASLTGGRYFRARSTTDMEQISEEFNQLVPVEQGMQPLLSRSELFCWPLALALLLSLGLLPLNWRRYAG